MSINVWIVKSEPGSDSLDGLLRFLLSAYESIFGADVMNNEECLVYNDPQGTCPMLIRDSNPIRIRLVQSSPSYWAQTIFQLSHELCHYAIRQSKNDKNFTLSWFEEIVCEAMSLYVLYWSSEHWESCILSSRDAGYKNAIRAYLNAELKKKGTEEFQNCTSIEKLKLYTAGENRESHRNERNLLYYEICKHPLLCRCFCDYQKYLESSRVAINFEEWERNDSNPLIQVLHSIQPCAESSLK